MPRRKRMDPIPLEVDRLVVAICGDYERRERILRRKSTEPETAAALAALNAAVDAAIAGVCEPGICLQIRRDIGERRGARRTPLYCLGEATYKRRKHEAKLSIARALHLM